MPKLSLTTRWLLVALAAAFLIIYFRFSYKVTLYNQCNEYVNLVLTDTSNASKTYTITAEPFDHATKRIVTDETGMDYQLFINNQLVAEDRLITYIWMGGDASIHVSDQCKITNISPR